MPKRESFSGRCCVDCLMYLANGEFNPDWTEDEIQHFLDEYNRLTEGCAVTLGMLREQHSCIDEDGKIANDYGNECYCEELGFSWTGCDSCGSLLGGERFAITFWPADK